MVSDIITPQTRNPCRINRYCSYFLGDLIPKPLESLNRSFLSWQRVYNRIAVHQFITYRILGDMHCLVLLLALAASMYSLDEADTKISSNRNYLRTTVCLYYSGNFTEDQRRSAQLLIDSYAYLNDQQIQLMLFHADFSSPDTQSMLMVLPHCIGLGVLILLGPALCCCCVWPERHPVCIKCRKPEKEMYTRCELKLPAFLAILCYLVLIAGTSLGLSEAVDLGNQLNNVGCRMLAVADDSLHGRISPSNDSVFFIGIDSLSSELSSFSSKLNTFFLQSENSLGQASTVRGNQTEIQQQIQSAYTSYTDVTYSNAFRQSDGLTYASVSSDFKDMHYGPVSASASILGNINSKLELLFTEINDVLDPLVSSWGNLSTVTEAGVSDLIDGMITSIAAQKLQLNATIEHYKYFNSPETFDSVNLGFKLLYGLALAFACLGLIALAVLALFTVVKVRLIAYVSCSLLYFLGIVTFGLCIVFGFLLPSVSQACSYVDEKLTSSSGSVDLFNALQFNSSAALFTNCLASSTGEMISELSPGFERPFDDIVLISDQSLQFNDLIPNFNPANFDAPFTSASTTLINIKQNKVLEVQDPVALQFLRGLARKSFNLAAGCNEGNVRGDSWTASKTEIPCEGGSFSQPPCSDLSDLTECPLGCYEIYEQIISPSGDRTNYAANLETRYGSGCNYAEYVTQLHQNWNIPRSNKMDQTQTQLSQIKNTVDDYYQLVGSIQAKLNTFKGILEGNFNSETNLETGSFNGVDCRVVGESITELRDSLCVGVLNSVYINLLVLGLISYSILMLVFLTVLTGVQHFKHLQRMQVKVGYKGVPVTISSNRILDKFYS